MSKIENNGPERFEELLKWICAIIWALAAFLFIAGLVQTKVEFRQRAMTVLSELAEMNDKADQILVELEGMK